MLINYITLICYSNLSKHDVIDIRAMWHIYICDHDIFVVNNVSVFLLFKANTTPPTTKYTSTYTQLSTANNSSSTVQLATELSTLSNSYTSWDLSTVATEMNNSLIYSSIYTTDEKATSRKSRNTFTSQPRQTTKDSGISRQTTSEPTNPPIHAPDDRETHGQTSKSTRTPSTRQSSTLSTTNRKSGASHQSKRIPQ